MERLAVAASADLRLSDDRGAHRGRTRRVGVVDPVRLGGLVGEEEDGELVFRELALGKELVAKVLAAAARDPEVARVDRLSVVLHGQRHRRVPRVRDEDGVAGGVVAVEERGPRLRLRGEVLAADRALRGLRCDAGVDAARLEAGRVHRAGREDLALAVDDGATVDRAGARTFAGRERRGLRLLVEAA